MGCAVLFLAQPAEVAAIEAVLTEDVSVSTSPKPRAARGDSQILNLSETDIVYLKFDLGSVLPANTPAERIEKATLKVWVHRVNGPGECIASMVNWVWNESDPLAFPSNGEPPPFGQPSAIAQSSRSKSFMVFDVTEHVRKWQSGTPNHGFALRGVRLFQSFIRAEMPNHALQTPLKAMLDSKENTGTGHAPSLQIVLKNAS